MLQYFYSRNASGKTKHEESQAVMSTTSRVETHRDFTKEPPALNIDSTHTQSRVSLCK